MGGRRKKATILSQYELGRFLATAEALHRACVDPVLSPQCEQYRSLQRLHEVLLATIKEVSGRQAEWISHSSTGTAGWLERNRA